MNKQDDRNYNTERDDVGNLNLTAFVQNTKAAAHAIGTYALSTEGIPAKRGVVRRNSRREVKSDDKLLVRRTGGKKTAAIR